MYKHDYTCCTFTLYSNEAELEKNCWVETIQYATCTNHFKTSIFFVVVVGYFAFEFPYITVLLKILFVTKRIILSIKFYSF